MTYRYNFDWTPAGNFGLTRANYRILQEGFNLLCQELEVWNQRALEHGAAQPPYEQEVAHLTDLIAWGDEQLGRTNTQEIVITGISVGNLRYVKAALIFLIRKREQDCAKKGREGWPDAALRSLTDSIGHVKQIAEIIDCEPSDVLWEVVPKAVANSRGEGDQAMEWDVFVSHASEDKEEFVRPLVEGLTRCGLKVWFDEFTLTLGDSLRRSIDRGLAHSRFGVVVVSPIFLSKDWPQRELDGLVAREVDGVKVILPVWHKISADEIRIYSPTLADRLAVSSDKGVDHVIAEVIRAIRRDDQVQERSSDTQERLIDAKRQRQGDAPVGIAKTGVTSSLMHTEGVDLLKKYLVDDAHRIELNDLVVQETEAVHAKLTDVQFPVQGVPFRFPEIADRLKQYESLTENLRVIVLTGCRWGEAKYAAYWARCLERIANPAVTHFGDGGWFNLRWYPALLVLYAGGVASMAASGYEALAALLSPQVKVRCAAGDLPLVRLVNTGMVLEDHYAVNLPGVKGYMNSKLTPFSQYLYAVLRESFRNMLPEDSRYETCFHRFECFLTLVHRDVVSDWSLALPGRFAWRDRKAWEDIVREAKEAKELWQPLGAGLFGGSLRRFTDAEAVSRKMLWGS